MKKLIALVGIADILIIVTAALAIGLLWGRVQHLEKLVLKQATSIQLLGELTEILHPEIALQQDIKWHGTSPAIGVGPGLVWSNRRVVVDPDGKVRFADD